MSRADIEWALRSFRGKRYQRYAVYSAYYDGNHPLSFATDKFRDAFGALFAAFADNLCPAVVDSLNDRLRLVGFTSSAAKSSVENIEVTTQDGQTIQRPRVVVRDPPAKDVWDIWKNNRMDLRAIQVQREAIKCGDSYVLVWPDNEGRAAIWPQRAHEIVVQYNKDTPGVIDCAAKLWSFWQADKRYLRLNLYYPDSVEKYVTPNSVTALPDKSDVFAALPGDEGGSNPYGRVPIFHFANQAMYTFGTSALKDAIPIQDALNKSVCDMLIAMEFAAFKQRWAVGLEVDVDEDTGKPKEAPFESGPGRVWTAPDTDTKFGEFTETDLGKFLDVSEKFRAQIARVTGTPLHYFFITTGDFPSGEALKSAEGRFVNKIEEAQTNYGNIWEDALAFARYVESGREGETFEAVWKPSAPRTESEIADIAVKKQAVGVSKSQNLKELGYSDDEIDRMFAENASNAPPNIPTNGQVGGLQPGRPLPPVPGRVPVAPPAAPSQVTSQGG